MNEPIIEFKKMTEEEIEKFKKIIDDYVKKHEWMILPDEKKKTN